MICKRELAVSVTVSTKADGTVSGVRLAWTTATGARVAVSLKANDPEAVSFLGSALWNCGSPVESEAPRVP